MTEDLRIRVETFGEWVEVEVPLHRQMTGWAIRQQALACKVNPLPTEGPWTDDQVDNLLARAYTRNLPPMARERVRQQVVALVPKEEVRNIIAGFRLRERQVLAYRLQIGLTFNEIGNVFGVHATRIQQWEGNALRQIRRGTERYRVPGEPEETLTELGKALMEALKEVEAGSVA